MKNYPFFIIKKWVVTNVFTFGSKNNYEINLIKWKLPLLKYRFYWQLA